MPRYLVTAAYTGDCCARAHVLTAWVDASDEATAALRVRRQLAWEQHTPSDVLVMRDDEIWNLTEIEATNDRECPHCGTQTLALTATGKLCCLGECGEVFFQMEEEANG